MSGDTNEGLERATRCLKALSHPTRLKILRLLHKYNEASVQQLENELGLSQSNTSQHLSVMREKEIIITRKEANQVFYRVRDERMFTLLALLQEIFCGDD